MLKKMLFKGAVLVASMVAANAVIEKFEQAELKREKESKKNESEKEEGKKYADEAVKRAMDDEGLSIV